ncbi:MAG: 4'-phosphopantetheinyl transferase superfamily protein [Halioglobus sp.]
MTKPLANASNASDTTARSSLVERTELAVGALHLWLCHRGSVADSDTFKRRVLSRYSPVAPSEWAFVLGKHGKPCTVGTTPELYFNLSHSGDWLACAVAADAAVGVDLEFCDSRREVMKLARRFFCPQEVSSLSACEPALQSDRFYDLWTLKEAAIKARGDALGPGLQRRCFEVNVRSDEHAAAAGSISVTASAMIERAHYYLLDPLPAYRVAICSLASSVAPPELRIFRWSGAAAADEHSVSLRASSRRM